MLTKTVLIASALCCVPLYFFTPTRAAAVGLSASPSASALVAASHVDLEVARHRAAKAEHESAQLRAQLDECLDLLVQTGARRSRHNCTPSRNRLVQFQWMHEHGHLAHADRVLDQIVSDAGRRPRQLTDLAKRLMTDKESAGKFDQVALALSMRATETEGPSARSLDTAALALFLNRRVDEAIELQRRALAEEDERSYRQRLRTYEAARKQPRESSLVTQLTSEDGQ